MTTEKRIAVIYATDFNSIAPGGIQNFIKLLAAENKNSSETTFFTRSAESRFHGSPNVQLKDNRFMNKMKIPNHLRFALSLRALKKDLREYDVLLLHRPEYALFIKHTKKILVLHGGSWNAMRAQGLLRGLLHLLIEFIAVNRSSLVISVNVEGQSDFIRKFIRIERAIKVPLNNTFVADKIRPNPSYIYSTSRLDPEKNIVNIIEISKLAEKSLILSGSGVLNQDSRFIGILQESKNVSYLGQRTPEELNQLYKSGGSFISLGVSEGYP
jgi:glycosyltransferase involved in cell wall biosynthesis